MKTGRINATFDYEYIKSNRKFPIGGTILLILIFLIQIALLIFGFSYTPKPLDVIHQYDITVKPLDDGSLDIEYSFVWEALDESEPLSWVEIGMPNENFLIYPDSVTPNTTEYYKSTSEDYVYLRLYFDQAYVNGEIFEFSFKINQKDMLCYNKTGYFYEFIPCWFNAIQVKQYEFVWLMDGKEDYIKRGSLDFGEYEKMVVKYDTDDFADCETVAYKPFDYSGAYNEIESEKNSNITLCCLLAAALIIAEVYIIDSHVSYKRGRGFLSGHGYYVHTYGRSNPHYIRARNAYKAIHHTRRFGGGGGCACACACACAGGGRAGCSQKDTFSISKHD